MTSVDTAAPGLPAAGRAGPALARLLGSVLACTMAGLTGCKDAGPAPGAGLAPAAAAPQQMPKLHFTDITAESGVQFVHRNGATGEKWLPETNVGGLAFFDFNGDGFPDLLAVSGTDSADPRHASATPTLRLWLNDGTGHFTEATDRIQPPFTGYGMSIAIGDFDGDGRDDVYIAALGVDRLYRNVDGKQLLLMPKALVPAGSDEGLSIASTFFDADADGDLDLLSTNYATWNRALDARTNDQIVGLSRTYAGPGFFKSHPPQFWENLGGGRLVEHAQTSGLAVRQPGTDKLMGKPLGILPIDLDGDGIPELVIANDKQPNFALFRGKDGRYVDRAAQLGLAYDSRGESSAAMGIDAAWLGPELALHIAMGNFSGEMTSLYRQDPATGQFFDISPASGVGAATRLNTTFGVLFADLDLDGNPDLVLANGHVEPDIARAQPSVSYQQAPRVLWHCATGCATRFVDVPAALLGDLAKPVAGRGLATADIDGDGDLDLVISEVGGPLRILRNDQQTGNRSLRVRLDGPPGNRRGVGALIDIEACGRKQRQQMMPNRGFSSVSEAVATFGLGTCADPARIQVTWPGKKTTVVEGVREKMVLVALQPAKGPDARPAQQVPGQSAR